MGPIIITFNIPYICDFFFSSKDATSSRQGRFLDAELIAGGLKLWRGNAHLIIELHALRKVRATFEAHSEPA